MPENEVGLAPMAGYTDEAMRAISLEWGADFVFSEMLSVEGVLRNDRTTQKIIPETPCRIQLFGNDIARLAMAAKAVLDKATWFDINAGCPVKKVVKRGAGAALLREPEKLNAMIQTLKGISDLPVSVKIRLGWDKNEVVKIVERLVESRPFAIMVHGRTVVQGYSGVADWESIGKVVKICKPHGIKVYGSGDVFSPEKIVEAFEKYGVDGVLVARGAIGNPWIFSQYKELKQKGSYTVPDPRERLKVFAKHLKKLIELKGEERAIIESRKHFVGYCKGLLNATKMRREYMKLKNKTDVENFLMQYGLDIKSLKL